MIRLAKLPKPRVLIENEVEWTTMLIRKTAAGESVSTTEKSRYRHPEIKATLIQETFGKCAYCESKLQHITYGDVEHISPKSTEPEAIFQWENLTLACDVCNTNKGDRFPNREGLVDPYNHDPQARFHIFGPFIFATPGDNDARYTELTLDLNRTALLERRNEKIKYLRDMVETVAAASERLRPRLLEVLKLETAPDQEFSALARSYLAKYL
jgi:5-methylcytosine-specific restriction endonuclease McrA